MPVYFKFFTYTEMSLEDDGDAEAGKVFEASVRLNHEVYPSNIIPRVRNILANTLKMWQRLIATFTI